MKSGKRDSDRADIANATQLAVISRSLKTGFYFPILVKQRGIDGWMSCHFSSFSTVFQSYHDDDRTIMKGCVQWNPEFLIGSCNVN